MREVQAVLVTAEVEQAKAWMLGFKPDYFSKLAGMHPERRFTLARTFHLLEQKDAGLRFAIDAERVTFEEQDGQMVQSFTDIPEVVIVQFEPVEDGVLAARASVVPGTPVEENLIEWVERLLETCRQAFEGKPEEEQE